MSEAEIIRRFKRDGMIFEDADFPPTQASVGSGLTKIARWIRVKDIFGPHAQLFAVGEGRVPAVTQGAANLGNRWLLNASAALAARPHLARQLFISTRGASAGVYTIQFFSVDEWVQVMIDDKLPCDQASQPLFAKGRPDEFWLPLLEKAFAKLAGSYAALAQGGTTLEALRDLTGGVPVVYDLLPADWPDNWMRPPQLTWERLQCLLQLRGPVVLYRQSAPVGRDRAAAADWQLEQSLTPRSIAGPLGQARKLDVAALTEVERGEPLHGVAYPVLEARVENGVQQVCIGRPWEAGVEVEPSPHPQHGASGRHSVKQHGLALALPDSRSTRAHLHGDDQSSRGAAWLPFASIHLHFDRLLGATGAAGAGTSNPIVWAVQADGDISAKAGVQRQLVVDGSWVCGTWAAFEVVISGEDACYLTALLSQPEKGHDGTSPAAALLLFQGFSDALNALRRGQPVPTELLLRHTLPARTQRDVLLDCATPLPPGAYYLVVHSPDGYGTARSRNDDFVIHIEAIWPLVANADASSRLGDISVTPLPPPPPPPTTAFGGSGRRSSRADERDSSFRLAGDTELDALLIDVEQAYPPPEPEVEIGVALGRLAAQPQRTAAVVRLQSRTRTRLLRGELGQMRALAAREKDQEWAHASVRLQAVWRGASLRRDLAARRKASLTVQARARGRAGRRLAARLRSEIEAAELEEIAVLKAFLDERARRIQAVARGRRARKEAVLRLPKLSAVIDAAVEAEAEAGSGAYDDDVRARLERIEQELRRLSQGGLRAQAEGEEGEEHEADGEEGDGDEGEDEGEEQEEDDSDFELETATESEMWAASRLQAGARGHNTRSALRRRQLVRRREQAATELQAAKRGRDAREHARMLRLQAKRRQRAEMLSMWNRGSSAPCHTSSPSAHGTQATRYVPRHAVLAVTHTEARPNFVKQGAENAISASCASSDQPAGTKNGGLGGELADVPVAAVHGEMYAGLSYRSRALALQQQQRSLLSQLPLAQPERATQLLVQKEDALQALMSRHAEMHCMANNLDGPPMERIVREMHAMVVEQRQRQQQYEMVNHQLMAELRQQRVPAADAAALANLSAELERSLARVAELEAHNHMHASESRGGFGANSSNGGYPGGTPGAGARLGAAEDLHSMDGSSGRRARGRWRRR